jgi:hypothetical protein
VIYTRTVTLNGTSENPYARMGLKCNPFPQIGKAEFDAVEMRLNKLAGDPIKSTDDIRQRLQGLPSDFVEYITEQYEPGATVTFTIELEGP